MTDTLLAAPPALTITVLGHRPAPQGSKKHVGRGRLIEQSARVKPWRQAVHDAAMEAVAAAGLAVLDGPLSVEVAFTVRKPASAPRHRITWPSTRDSGDIDKLLRSTFDALSTAAAIADDARIVEVVARKMHPVEGADGNLFYPDSYTGPVGKKQVEKARTYCDRCPVAAACLEAALDKEGQKDAKSRHGIRGGCIPSERVLLSKTRRFTPAA